MRPTPTRAVLALLTAAALTTPAMLAAAPVVDDVTIAYLPALPGTAGRPVAGAGVRVPRHVRALRRYAGDVSSVTLWGLADDNTWLDTFPVTRKDAPLLFDTRLQAKPAYWAWWTRRGSRRHRPPRAARCPTGSPAAGRAGSRAR